jgi:hypothetical protein
MSAPVFTTPPGSEVIAVDSSDPNTAAPSELRTFPGTTGKDTDPSALYAVGVGGSITLQVWAFFTSLNRWAKLGSATACAADTVTTLSTPPVGTAKLYAQVTVNTAGTQFAIGYLGSR